MNLGQKAGEVTVCRPLYVDGKSKSGEKEWKLSSFNGSEMRTISKNVLLIFQGYGHASVGLEENFFLVILDCQKRTAHQYRYC